MNSEQMLEADVSRRLADAGAPHDAEATAAAIRSTRDDIAVLLHKLALGLVQCTNTGCGCLVAATVYNAVSTEIRDHA